jgi:hypothetical protein
MKICSKMEVVFTLWVSALRHEEGGNLVFLPKAN